MKVDIERDLTNFFNYKYVWLARNMVSMHSDMLNASTMNKRDIRAKQAVVRATDSIRNKFHQIRSTHLENTRLLEEQYKPITKKLNRKGPELDISDLENSFTIQRAF